MSDMQAEVHRSTGTSGGISRTRYTTPIRASQATAFSTMAMPWCSMYPWTAGTMPQRPSPANMAARRTRKRGCWKCSIRAIALHVTPAPADVLLLDSTTHVVFFPHQWNPAAMITQGRHIFRLMRT